MLSAGQTGNYVITYANGTLTVLPSGAAYDHSNDASKTYGQTASFAARVHGHRPGDGDTITGVTETSTGWGGGGGRDLLDRAWCRDAVHGPEQQLHDHLRQRHPDRQPSPADHHRERRDQDLRPDGIVRPVPRSRPAAWWAATPSPASPRPARDRRRRRRWEPTRSCPAPPVLGGPSSNYTIAYANGTLTVNPAAVSITANSASKTYGQTARSPAPHSRPAAWSTAIRSAA